METAIGVLLGALATVLASRYYYLRSVKKNLSVYGLLDSLVFAGIEQDVRQQLHFRFRDKEVTELQQLVLLIANDGERAISNILAAPSISLPEGVELLDASLLHRHPDSLQVRISTTTAEPQTVIGFEFPLLNKGEFFVAKLLLSGRLSRKDTKVSLLADDLPRTLSILDLPPSALEEKGYRMEWPLAVGGTVFLILPAWVCYVLYLLRLSQPTFFPYPWSTFVVSLGSLALLIPGAILLLIFGLLGVLMLVSAPFGGDLPPRRGARFPLPKELRNAVFPYRGPHLLMDAPVTETSVQAAPASPEGERSNNELQRTRRG